jgi:mannan endo-1,4-beta-mannosidase
MARTVIAISLRIMPAWTICLMLFFSCHPEQPARVSIPADSVPYPPPREKPADTLLTYETRALWINLKRLQGKGIIFGQQDATITGVDWYDQENRSDIRDVTGTYPALYGWEIAGVGNKANIDSVLFTSIRQRMIEAFNRGGINTVTWHLNNPITQGAAWDVYPAVSQILPDSSAADSYKTSLKQLASFFKNLKNEEGKSVPVIFRPFHESNGNWFWWGKDHCTAEEYIVLWRYTVAYLRDSLQIHNLLYAFSTDMFESRYQYLERYPGDEWVDILGTENYWDFQSGASISNGLEQLRILVTLSKERKKLAALTECGFEGIPVKNWWTQFLLKPISDDSVARNISYIMVWRNANRKHFYTPFIGHKSVPDFVAFEQDTFTIFEKDLVDMYRYKTIVAP